MRSVRPMIDELETLARGTLPAQLYDYVAGGSGAEISLDEASRAWRGHRLVPRVLCDVGAIATAVQVCGTTLPSPIALAPMGYQQLLHPDGEVASAQGADDHLLVVSARADVPLERIGTVARGWWFQTYRTRDRSVGDDLVDRAVDAGARAIVLTGDTPYVAAKARSGRLRDLPAGADQAPATFADIERLAGRTGLPVVVKGVLHPDDARRAVAHGAAGIVVSNHGGRQLDRAVSTAAALAPVVDACGDVPVLVDGGLRDGTDVLTALGLGARAVLVGRPMAWALASGGAAGVRDLLRAWDDDLRHVLGLAGVTRCDDVPRDLVARDVT